MEIFEIRLVYFSVVSPNILERYAFQNLEVPHLLRSGHKFDEQFYEKKSHHQMRHSMSYTASGHCEQPHSTD